MWAILGTVFFIFNNDNVNRLPQKIVFYALSGPFIWATDIFQLLAIIVYKIYIPFHNWLTKK
jgi:hypothetical protein